MFSPTQDPYMFGAILLALRQAEDEGIDMLTEEEIQERIAHFKPEDELEAIQIGERVTEAFPGLANMEEDDE